MQIKVKRLSSTAVMPTKAHTNDAGLDLTCSDITTEINECGQLILVYHTGIAIEIPEGYFALLVPRSSIFKKSITLTNCSGVIDSGYRGEILAKFRTTTDVVPSVYKVGERFAQLLILPVPDVQMIESDTLSDSDRGEGGYGSTGNTNINEQSAPADTVGYPEQKSELTNQETADNGSGEAQGGLEQA